MKKIIAEELFAFLRKEDISIEIYGNTEAEITGFSSLDNYKEGSITWIKDKFMADLRKGPRLAAVVCPPNIEIEAEVKIIADNPKDIFFTAMAYLDDSESLSGIAQTAVLGKNVQIGENVFIGEYCCIGDNVKIDDDTKIEAHVVLYSNVKIGKRCLVKAGAVIGGEGFGYSKRNHVYHKAAHYGGVTIGDDVDIGSNTCVDCGTIEDTVIANGVKIDNLCHIAHNVTIGSDSCIVANSTICGSVSIGQNVYIAPSATVLNQMQIEDGAVIGMGAGVLHHILPDTVNVGFPARAIRDRTEADWKKY